MSELKSVRKKQISLIGLRLWLSAIDPGLIRTLSAGRAALALLSIWLVLRTAVQMLPGGNNPFIPLFGVQAGMVLLLFIIDLRPSDRKVSLWLATIPFAGAIILASFLADNFWLNFLILLLLFFCSYFFRRYGARAGELALVATQGYYLGFLLVPPPAVFPLILVCIAFSALVVYLWQFVILPYDPVKSLHRSVNAFYHNVARGVGSVRQGLDNAQGYTPDTEILQRSLRQVHLNRRVIEGLFSAAVSPTLWSQPRLNHLQEELFKTERGLELLIEAAGKLTDQLNELPEPVLHTLIEGLSALEDHLWEMAFGEGQAQLAEIGERLQLQLQSSLEEKPAGEWAFSLLRMGVAVRQLAQSVAKINRIETAWNESASEAPQRKLQAVSPPVFIKSQGKKAGFALHPTTILGLQAVLAAGLAMLAAYLLKMDSPSLVFWTAFVVIAGSTGESLRRITLRIGGVIAGTLIGVALAILLPDYLPLVVLLVTISLFLSVYTLTTSYIWMVFWLNIAVLLGITSLGGAALELLVLRPVSTLVGGAAAALVVAFVLPIHVQDRFITALSSFMTAVDRYIEVYVATLTGTPTTSDLKVEELNIDASYKKLEQNLPNVIYEYNPLSRAQNPLASQATSLAVLRSYVIHLNDDVGGEPGILKDSMQSNLIRSIQSQLHANVDALNQYLARGQGEENQPLSELSRQSIPEITLEEILSSEAGSVEEVRNRALYHLMRIHDTILQIVLGLGAQTTSR